jgi:hypothetical protein
MVSDPFCSRFAVFLNAMLFLGMEAALRNASELYTGAPDSVSYSEQVVPCVLVACSYIVPKVLIVQQSRQSIRQMHQEPDFVASVFAIFTLKPTSKTQSVEA